jgi:hypothetical protein
MGRWFRCSAIASLCATAIATFGGFKLVPGLSSNPITPASAQKGESLIVFPEGTATPSEFCGTCHQAIYQEFFEGRGTDLHWPRMQNYLSTDAALQILEGLAKSMPLSATAHSVAGTDPWPLDAVKVEEHGNACNVCHYPNPIEYPQMNAAKIEKPTPRDSNREAGVTCASCHLTPDGKIRGPYAVEAPHATVQDERTKTSVACATCHSEGERVIGKQTQTFLEWREDFFKAGLGTQHCQDCHMPRTVRKLAEDFDLPERVVARHLWTGSHSFERLVGALTLAITQASEGRAELAFHINNVGAGHSVPTGSNRRAVYLIAEVVDASEQIVTTKEWMFAPWFGNRPDDRAFLEEDFKGPHPRASSQADMQGPHETIIRAGEERALAWTPDLPAGRYTVRSRLIYDLNRYNDRAFDEDQREMTRSTLEMTIGNRSH